MPWRKGNRLRTVAEQEADPSTRRIYDEIKGALSLPGLQLYYPALGAYPRFLALHWQTVRHVASSRELFTAAECLRADAYTRTHNYFHVPDLRREAILAPALPANYFHYRDPLILLLFAFQMQAMEGPTGKAPDGAAEQDRAAPPRLLFNELPPSISEKNAPAALRNRYEEIRRTLGTPFIAPEFCAFAARPEFLDAYWKALKQMLASPLYPACKHGLRSSAWTLAAQLPGPAELSLDQMADAGLFPEDIASIARILELFVDSLTGSLLNVAAAKIAIEGGNLVASESPRAQGRQPAA
jgi:hypothetical protein